MLAAAVAGRLGPEQLARKLLVDKIAVGIKLRILRGNLCRLQPVPEGDDGALLLVLLCRAFPERGHRGSGVNEGLLRRLLAVRNDNVLLLHHSVEEGVAVEILVEVELEALDGGNRTKDVLKFAVLGAPTVRELVELLDVISVRP